VGEVNDFKEKVVLAKVPRAVFHREMLAGETLIYETEIQHLRPEGASVLGKVYSGGQLTAEVEIFFAHLDQNRAQQMFGEHNFVFSGEMRNLVMGLTRGARKPPPPASPEASTVVG